MSDHEAGLDQLRVWQAAVRLAVFIYRTVIPAMPVEEKYALAGQLRRAVQSIPANIAEGHGRYYYQETIRFCYIARGSLEETRSHIVLANKLEYLTDQNYQDSLSQIEEVRRMLNGYIAFLKNCKPGSNEPGSKIRENVEPYDASPYETSAVDESLVDALRVDTSPFNE